MFTYQARAVAAPSSVLIPTRQQGGEWGGGRKKGKEERDSVSAFLLYDMVAFT
jgi:hypothetical protein